MQDDRPTSTITPDLTLAEIMSRWPETTPVFMTYHMTCVGCYLSPFDTLADASAVFDLPLESLLEDLNASIGIHPLNNRETDHEP
jgi:hybrid cluster-associated redox disulfide protein